MGSSPQAGGLVSLSIPHVLSGSGRSGNDTCRQCICTRPDPFGSRRTGTGPSPGGPRDVRRMPGAPMRLHFDSRPVQTDRTRHPSAIWSYPRSGVAGIRQQSVAHLCRKPRLQSAVSPDPATEAAVVWRHFNQIRQVIAFRPPCLKVSTLFVNRPSNVAL